MERGMLGKHLGCNIALRVRVACPPPVQNGRHPNGKGAVSKAAKTAMFCAFESHAFRHFKKVVDFY